MTRRGFTLVETIFSSLFIGVTVLAIINLFPGAYLSIRQSETTLQADIIGKSVLDELRSNLKISELADFGPQLTSNSGLENPPFLPLAESPYRQTEVGGIKYEPTVTLYAVPGYDPQSLVRVRVKVAYRLNLSQKETVHETLLHAMTIRRNGFFQSAGANP